MRGYGLVDSPKMRAKPGQTPRSDGGDRRRCEAAAAHYYPAIYWFVMMKTAAAEGLRRLDPTFRRTSTFDGWRKQMNNVDCVGCHQLGQEATRTIPAQFGPFKSGEEAWQRRISSPASPAR